MSVCNVPRDYINICKLNQYIPTKTQAWPLYLLCHHCSRPDRHRQHGLHCLPGRLSNAIQLCRTAMMCYRCLLIWVTQLWTLPEPTDYYIPYRVTMEFWVFPDVYIEANSLVVNGSIMSLITSNVIEGAFSGVSISGVILQDNGGGGNPVWIRSFLNGIPTSVDHMTYNTYAPIGSILPRRSGRARGAFCRISGHGTSRIAQGNLVHPKAVW